MPVLLGQDRVAEEIGIKKAVEAARDAATQSLVHITGLVKALGFGGPAVLMCTLLMLFLVRNENPEVVKRVWPDLWWAWKWLVVLWLAVTGMVGGLLGIQSWRASGAARAPAAPSPGQYELTMHDPRTGQATKVRMTVSEGGKIEATADEPTVLPPAA